MLQTKPKIIYTGLDPHTLLLLAKEDSFVVGGVSYIPEFFTWSINPCNYLFMGIYALRYQNRIYFLERFLQLLWPIASPFSSGIHRRYAEYLSHISRERLEIIDVYDPEVAKTIRSNKYDLMVVNSWGMLPREVIDAPRYGTLNIHPSKLPQYRGALPTLWSLKNDDTESAVTYILLSEKQDAGDVIAQHVFSIDNTDTWCTIEEKVSQIIVDTLVSAIKQLLFGTLVPKEQDLRYASKTDPYEAYRKIDFATERAVDIYNKVHLYPHLEYGTFCYFERNGRRIYVRACSYSDSSNVKQSEKYTDFLFPRITFNTKGGTIILRLGTDLFLKDTIAIFLERLYSKKYNERILVNDRRSV